jgi:hypothetical protein
VNADEGRKLHVEGSEFRRHTSWIIAPALHLRAPWSL